MVNEDIIDEDLSLGITIQIVGDRVLGPNRKVARPGVEWPVATYDYHTRNAFEPRARCHPTSLDSLSST